MIHLEQTIIACALDHLRAVKAFYRENETGTTGDAQIDYQRDHTALYALLELGHLRDSGMSPEGSAALLAVEEDAATSFRCHCAVAELKLDTEG